VTALNLDPLYPLFDDDDDLARGHRKEFTLEGFTLMLFFG
jgi:hypothetical protein